MMRATGIFERTALLRLSGLFLFWKLLLFAAAIVSPGNGYDTSTALLSQAEPGVIGKLVRWDAVYYTKTAQRGYVFEQEWAFGWGLTRLLHFTAKCNPASTEWLLPTDQQKALMTVMRTDSPKLKPGLVSWCPISLI